MKNKQYSLYKDIAKLVAKQSNCQRLHVGAAIVDSSARVIATGYNGTVSGFNNCSDLFRDGSTVSLKLEQYLINVKFVLHDSLIPQDGNIYYVTYVPDVYSDWVCVSPDVYRKLHHMFSELYEVHAEQNALLNLVKTNTSIDSDSSIFITTEPCCHCAKLIAASGIKHVYYVSAYDSIHHDNADYFKKYDIEYRRLSDG